MSELTTRWILAVGGGSLIAVVYFASLWWTVRRVTRTRHPWVLIGGTFVLRMALASLALVGAATGDVVRLLAALGAFLVVRTMWIRSIGAAAPTVSMDRALSGKP